MYKISEFFDHGFGTWGQSCLDFWNFWKFSKITLIFHNFISKYSSLSTLFLVHKPQNLWEENFSVNSFHFAGFWYPDFVKNSNFHQFWFQKILILCLKILFLCQFQKLSLKQQEKLTTINFHGGVGTYAPLKSCFWKFSKFYLRKNFFFKVILLDFTPEYCFSIIGMLYPSKKITIWLFAGF